MTLDAITYLPDDILVKVDAAMGVSKTRPDHRVVEFAWQLPQHLKLRVGVGKGVARCFTAMCPAFIERPKMGWCTADSCCADHCRMGRRLVKRNTLASGGILHPFIRHKWDEHLSGTNWASLVGCADVQSWYLQQQSPSVR